MDSSKSHPHPSTFLGERRLSEIRGYVVHQSRTPARALRILTPSQTVGPFFAVDLVSPADADLARKSPGALRAQGTPISVSGQITDEDGKPVRKALIEIWQANVWGKYEHPDDITAKPLDPHFKGWGRALSDAEGRYRFTSIKPGAYPNPGYDNWMRPPHIHFSVFAAGVMERLITQLYFPGEDLNDIDPILNGIDDLAARETLIATRLADEPDGMQAYRFDIVLRGKAETLFFVGA